MTIIEKSEITKSLRNIISTVTNNNDRNALSLKVTPEGTMLLTQLQTLFDFKFLNKTDDIIYSLLMRHASAAEKMSPGGFELCLRLVRDDVLQINDNHLNKIKEVSLESASTVRTHNPLNTDINWLFDTFCKNDDVKNLLIDTLSMTGFAGKITIEKSVSDKKSIELINGFVFKTSYGITLSAEQRLKNVRMVLIDGYIESVSEIHSVLTQAFETKENVLLFVRGLSADVQHTLKVNLDRKMLSVYPLIVELDLEGINMLADLSAVSGSDVISSLKGDLITCIKLSDCPLVDSVFLSKNGVIILNEKRLSYVNSHINTLKERRQLAETDFLIDLLDKRIRSLSTKHSIIRLVNDKQFVFNSQLIDHVLRAYSSMMDHGILIIDEKKYLAGCCLASVLFYRKCINLLNDLGAIIT